MNGFLICASVLITIRMFGCTSDRPPMTDWSSRVRLEVQQHDGFVLPAHPPRAMKPWVWYAPVIANRVPWVRQQWISDALRRNGIALAGVDVGESYGSPDGQAVYNAFYATMVTNGYDPKPILWVQSRGGLMLYPWAESHARQVRCIGGIYPVANLASWPPDLTSASAAYHLPMPMFRAELARFNPIDHVASLDAANIPILLLHGDRDRVVPAAQNSLELARRDTDARVITIRGRGHEEVPEFFESTALRDFLIHCAP